MTTIYVNSKEKNYDLGTGYLFSVGSSGIIYGTAPVVIGSDGTIVNHGRIEGGYSNHLPSSSAIDAAGNLEKITNYGSILGVSTDTILYQYPWSLTGVDAAIYLAYGGTITNKSSARIGYIRTYSVGNTYYSCDNGIDALSSASITNAGSIGGGSNGIRLFQGVITNTGSIHGVGGTGVQFNAVGTLTNSGNVTGGSIGVSLLHGGKLVNQAGGVIVSTGGPNDGVYAKGGYSTTVENYGSIRSLVNVGDDATVTNSGSIGGGSSAIHLNTSTTGAGASVSNTGEIGQSTAGSGGVWFDGDGTLDNSGVIQAPAYGVSVARGTVSIVNLGQIEAANGPAVTVSGGQVRIVNGGLGLFPHISGKIGVLASASAVVTITNYNVIQGTGGYAVELLNKSDGFIAHPGSDPIGTVKASGGLLEFASGASTYMHDTLGGSYSGFGAYRIDSGGSWAMHGTNTIKSGLTLTNYGHLSLYGTLNNGGDIFHYGADVKTFGVLSNAGYLSTGGEAVTLGLYGTLSNTGTVRGTGLTNAQGAVEVTHTSTITNSAGGIIEGYNGVRGVSVTLTNSGLVHGYNSCGVYLTGGTEITVSKITNTAGGTITGGNYGVFARSAESITNAGLMSGGVAGVAGRAILVNSGKIIGGQWGVLGHASVTNYGSILYGIGGGGAAFVHNAGYIKGGNLTAGQYAVELAPGGSLTQVAGGTIIAAPGRSIGSSGGAGIHVAAGTLAASVDLAGGGVQGGAGIFGISYAYTSHPPGAGGAGGAGIDFIDTGSLTVGAGVTVAGGSGGQGGKGKSSGGTGGAGGDGLNFDAAGAIYNAGVIVGGAGGAAGLNGAGPAAVSGAGGAGLFLGGGGTVDNVGSLEGAAAGSGGTTGLGGAGVSATAGGTVFNHGQIGGYDGVRQTGAGALTTVNYGAISGSRDSVLFGNAADRLVVESGSTFVGEAVGGGGTLEITSAGITVNTITGLGSSGVLSGESNLAFTGFGAYQVDAGAIVDETGAIGSGKTLINNGLVTAPSPNSVTLASGGTILNHGWIDADPATNYRGGVEADSGGRIVNYAGGEISAQEGISGAGFTLVNYGLVAGTGNCSVYINGPTASITNTATGTLQGYNYGVVSVQAATVVTAGSINGQIASVEFRDPTSLLVAEAGAVFTGGSIRGGGGTIVAAGGSDTLSGLGGTVATLSGSASGALGGFNSYRESGGTLTLSGVETLLAGKTFTNSGILLVTGTLTNLGAMHGGTGAVGVTYFGPAGPGGAGYTSATVSGGTLINRSSAIGGVGGAGGLGYTSFKYIAGFSGGAGGAGGAGVTVSSGRLTNIASIVGGVGGAGGAGGALPSGPEGVASGGAGGAGGAGVSIAGGTATSRGLIQGGAGGVGGYSIIPAYGGAGGAGGAGVFISGGGFTNTGTILGGAGGAGMQFGAGGAAGDGVLATGGGKVVNGIGGLISGLNGVEDAGKGGLTVTNQGSIAGTHDGIRFAAASDRLIVDAGAKFTGVAVGGGGTVEFNEGGGTVALAGGTGTMAGAVTLGFSDFGSYQLDAGRWTLSASGTLMAGQTLRLATSATTLAQGVVSNAGTIAVQGVTALTELIVTGAGATLSGGGAVALDGLHARITGNSTTATLTNLDNTIAGDGSIGVGDLVLVNGAAGVIDATGLLVVRTSGPALISAGLIEATSGGSLDLISTILDQSGGGTLWSNLGTVNLEGATVVGGTLASAGTSAIRINAATATLEGSKSAVMLTGAVQVLRTGNLVVDGALDNSGKLSLFAGTLTAGTAGVTLSGGGEVILNGSAANLIAGTTTLTNLDNRIIGSGNLGAGTLTLINDGVIVDGQSVGLTIDTGVHAITNAGIIAATAAGGGVTVKSALDNTGQVQASNGGTLSLLGAVTGAGSCRISGGRLIVAGAFAENVAFIGGAGVLELDDSVGFTGKVGGLVSAGTDSLDLRDITFTKGVTAATYSGTATSGTLTVTDGTHTAHIKLTGNYLGATFAASSDGHGGTKVVDPRATTLATPALAPAPEAGALAQAIASFKPEKIGGIAIAITPRPIELWALMSPHVETA